MHQTDPTGRPEMRCYKMQAKLSTAAAAPTPTPTTHTHASKRQLTPRCMLVACHNSDRAAAPAHAHERGGPRRCSRGSRRIKNPTWTGKRQRRLAPVQLRCSRAGVWAASVEEEGLIVTTYQGRRAASLERPPPPPATPTPLPRLAATG